MTKLLEIIQNFLTYIFLVKVKYTPDSRDVISRDTPVASRIFEQKYKKISLFFFREILNYGVSKKRLPGFRNRWKYLFQDQKTTVISAFSYGSRNRPLNGNNADIPFTLKRMAAEDKRWFYPPSYVLFIGRDEKSGGSIFHDKW